MQKWYNELLFTEGKSKTQDGLSSLLDMFDSESNFYKHFIENTIFFNPEHIEKQKKEYFDIHLLENKHLAVRFSTKSDKHFYFKAENGRGFSVKKFKKRTEAHDFSRKNNLYYRLEDGKEVLVHIDKDGNYEVRKQIDFYTNIKVSQGTKISNFSNYTISHIWENTTTHPLYFTALWNICLIPSYLSFILDKSDNHSVLVRRLKLIMKGLCYKYYKPEILSKEEINNLMIDLDFIKQFEIYSYKKVFV